KPGEISQLISDSGGHYIYKLNSKEVLPLDDKVKQEIHNTMQGQNMRDSMEQYTNSFKVDTNEAYFGPAGPAGRPGPPVRLPNPKLPPSPTAPAAQPQAQPAAPPSDAKPN